MSIHSRLHRCITFFAALVHLFHQSPHLLIGYNTQAVYPPFEGYYYSTYCVYTTFFTDGELANFIGFCAFVIVVAVHL